MADDPPRSSGGSDRPEYRLYGSAGSRLRHRRSERDGRFEGLGDPPGRERPDGEAPGPGAPDYRVYRARPRGLRERLRGEEEGLGDLEPGRSRGRGRGGRRGRSTVRRVLAYIALAIGAWLLLSLILFLVSAQIEQSKVSTRAKSALASGGFPLTSASTILVLGSDQRPKGSKEPGASTSGPSRSDTIMLIRAGGGDSARLSIPRDTVVPIPGHGLQKINAAYAYGGAALSIETIQRWAGIKINHLVEVNFTNFPKFIDSLGGIDVTTGCVVSDISGGTRNGGFSLRLHKGTNHLDGKQALTLARTRHNKCNPAENDLARARHQQAILSGIKSALVSPGAFFRLPWVSWAAPQAIRTDMGGFSLLGLFGSMATAGSPPTRVLKPSGFVTLPDGEQALTVSDSEKRAEVRRFLKG